MAGSGPGATKNEAKTSLRGRRWGRNGLVLPLVSVVVLAATGAWVALEPPSLAAMIGAAEQWRDSPFAVPVALVVFVVGGLVVFPVSLLIAASLLVFGPFIGGVVALCGSVSSAIAVHELGRWLPPALVTRALGSRGEALRTRLVDHGLLAMAVIRIVPVAPFSVVSLFAGITRIRRVDYIFGTAIGMLPGIVVYTIFMERAREVLMHPHPMAWLGLLGAITLILALALGTRAWSRRRARGTGGRA